MDRVAVADKLREDGALGPSRYVPDEAAIARWAAWYDGLPELEREALDEVCQRPAKSVAAE
jgi:hypothetical protein